MVGSRWEVFGIATGDKQMVNQFEVWRLQQQWFVCDSEGAEGSEAPYCETNVAVASTENLL